MVGFVLVELGDLLLQAGLYGAVRAVQYGIPQSTQIFYTVLERYNPETCTFCTPLGEMRLALHEMYEVSGLVIGDAPYEVYVSSTEELHLLKKSDPLVYETYWKVLCHFHICRQLTGQRNKGVKQISWGTYLFPGASNLASWHCSDARTWDSNLASWLLQCSWGAGFGSRVLVLYRCRGAGFMLCVLALHEWL